MGPCSSSIAKGIKSRVFALPARRQHGAPAGGALRHPRSLERLKRIIPYAAVCGRSRVPYDVRGV